MHEIICYDMHVMQQNKTQIISTGSTFSIYNT